MKNKPADKTQNALYKGEYETHKVKSDTFVDYYVSVILMV